jgi:hypothetical protein
MDTYCFQGFKLRTTSRDVATILRLQQCPQPHHAAIMV